MGLRALMAEKFREAQAHLAVGTRSDAPHVRRGDPIVTTTTYASRIGTAEPARRGAASYTLVMDEHADAAQGEMLRLDAPCQSALMGYGVAEAQTIEAWVGHRLAGRAAVARQQLAGPPLRGVYRIHGVAVYEPGDGPGLIEQAIGYAVAKGGRLLWCHTHLGTVDLWRRCGFAIAGPPLAAPGGGVRVLMTRRLTPADTAS